MAATAVPALGAYDSRDTHVLEQHARWIVESGAGAIDVSWWGRGGYEEQSVPRLMDVMRDYGLKVTFQLEPYNNARTDRYAADILYLLTEYGDKRHWDCLLVLENADGTESPIFRAFATIMGPVGPGLSRTHVRRTVVAAGLGLAAADGHGSRNAAP